MNYLAIDFGLKHIGLAVATTPLAEPLKTIPASKALEELPQLIADYQIDTVVIGVSEGDMAQKTKSFAAKLQKLINQPVVFQDETLTSQAAKQKLRTAKKKKRSGPDHHYAATLILQDYLDTQVD